MKSNFISPSILSKIIDMQLYISVIEYAQQVLIYNEETMITCENFQTDILNSCLGSKNLNGNAVNGNAVRM